jgi:hypothetical protein
MKKVRLFISVFFVPLCLAAQQKAEKALHTLDEKYPQEKIHLFINKEAFNAGETIWFKAYLFSGNVQSNISKTLYVELLNDQKHTVSQLLLPLVKAVGGGSIALPANLPEGNYYLRAYTSWMLNFDESFQYFYQLPVYNQHSLQKLTDKPVAWTATLYPESGSLVAGKENKAAIRLTAKGKLPEKWQGYIAEQDSPGKALFRFTSLNAQLALFNILPQNGKRYVAHVYDSFGNKSIIPFQPSAQGVLLKAKQNGRVLEVEIGSQGITEGLFNSKIVAASHGSLFYSGTIKKKDSLVRIAIPVEALLSGVVQLTLFDSREKPVAERLIFLQTEPLASLNVSVGSTVSPDEITGWKIISDSSWPGNSTASIEIVASIHPFKRSIKSDLWLGDFSSDIFEPNQYFRGDSIWREALDALLITEKWTRYNWEKILADSFPAISHVPEGYLSFSGTVFKNKVPLKDATLNFMLKLQDSSSHLWQVNSNKAGEFFLNDIAFFDSMSIYQLSGDKKNPVQDTRMKWKRMNNFSAFTGNLPFSPFFLQEKSKTGLSETPATKVQNRLIRHDTTKRNKRLLEEVIVKTTIKTPTQLLDEELSSPLFTTGNQRIIDFVNEEQNVMAYNNVFDWLEGRVAGLNFMVLSEDKRDPLTKIVIPAGERIPMMRGGIPVIFLDEILTDVTNIHSLTVTEIAMIKVISGFFIGAPGGGNGYGTIAIYTKKAGLMQKDKSLNIPTVILQGYPRPVKATNQAFYWNHHPFETDSIDTGIIFQDQERISPKRLVITGFTDDARPIFYEKILKTTSGAGTWPMNPLPSATALAPRR